MTRLLFAGFVVLALAGCQQKEAASAVEPAQADAMASEVDDAATAAGDALGAKADAVEAREQPAMPEAAPPPPIDPGAVVKK